MQCKRIATQALAREPTCLLNGMLVARMDVEAMKSLADRETCLLNGMLVARISFCGLNRVLRRRTCLLNGMLVARMHSEASFFCVFCGDMFAKRNACCEDTFYFFLEFFNRDMFAKRNACCEADSLCLLYQAIVRHVC